MQNNYNEPLLEAKIGQWYGIGDDGLIALSDNEDFTVCEGFSTKKELINDIRARLQDSYKKPHVSKVKAGYYKLDIKFEDDFYVYDLIHISDKEKLIELEVLYQEYISEPK